MLTKAIKYVDYNGETKTKNFYFNLSETELTKMNLTAKGGMKEVIKEMINSDDNKRIVELFEEIVLGAYGEKSADGEAFMKSDAIREKFKCHPAYDVLFIQLLEGGEKTMGEFINAVIPQRIAEGVKDVDREAMLKEIIPSVD